MGTTGIPVFNVNNNCSTASSAMFLARVLVQSGQYDCVMALGFEKMERNLSQLVFSPFHLISLSVYRSRMVISSPTSLPTYDRHGFFLRSSSENERVHRQCSQDVWRSGHRTPTSPSFDRFRHCHHLLQESSPFHQQSVC